MLLVKDSSPQNWEIRNWLIGCYGGAPILFSKHIWSQPLNIKILTHKQHSFVTHIHAHTHITRFSIICSGLCRRTLRLKCIFNFNFNEKMHHLALLKFKPHLILISKQQTFIKKTELSFWINKIQWYFYNQVLIQSLVQFISSLQSEFMHTKTDLGKLIMASIRPGNHHSEPKLVKLH